MDPWYLFCTKVPVRPQGKKGMKTERNNHPTGQPAGHTASGPGNRQHHERSQKGSPAGGVDIASRAREAARIMEEAKKVSDVREDLVLRLREAIKSGTYNVKGSDVAEKLIKESLLGSIL